MKKSKFTTGIESMPLRTPVGCLTTELRRTRDELDHIDTRFMYDMSPAYC